MREGTWLLLEEGKERENRAMGGFMPSHGNHSGGATWMHGSCLSITRKHNYK